MTFGSIPNYPIFIPHGSCLSMDYQAFHSDIGLAINNSGWALLVEIIFRKFAYPRLTSPPGPIEYSIVGEVCL